MKRQGLGFVLIIFFLFPTSQLKAGFDPLKSTHEEREEKAEHLRVRKLKATSKEEYEVIERQSKALRMIVFYSIRTLSPPKCHIENYVAAKKARGFFRKICQTKAKILEHQKTVKFLKVLESDKPWRILDSIAKVKALRCYKDLQKSSVSSNLSELYKQKIDLIKLSRLLYRHKENHRMNRLHSLFIPDLQLQISKLIRQIKRNNKQIAQEEECLHNSSPLLQVL